MTLLTLLTLHSVSQMQRRHAVFGVIVRQSTNLSGSLDFVPIAASKNAQQQDCKYSKVAYMDGHTQYALRKCVWFLLLPNHCINCTDFPLWVEDSIVCHSGAATSSVVTP